MNTRTDITVTHDVRVGPLWLNVAHVKRAAAVAVAAAALTGGAWLGTALAHAQPDAGEGDVVYLSQMDDKVYLDCAMEDCSDIPAAALPGIWTDPDTGDAYLTYEGRSYAIVDDTVTGGVR